MLKQQALYNVMLKLTLLAPGLLRFLLGKFADMQTFAGESMTAEGGMAFGYYKEGAHNPTFAYISKAMEAEKVRIVKLRCIYRL